ncbi:hypothetical protein BJV82DRAFT_696974 [Fennellomyces sp. T-0311]|nr:hypothetical protein BJV82DRAFT_696974 [Fennellomyces sp. T-0311]
MTVDVTSASSSASKNSHQRKIIPAPRITQEIDTEERGFSIRVVKDHILRYVIKAANDELTNSEAEALYQTMRGELNTALDVLESRVKKEILSEMYEEDQYAYEDVAGVDESDVDMKANKCKPGKQNVEKDQLVQKHMRFIEDEGEDEEEDESKDEEEEDEYEDEKYTKDDDE